MALSNSTPESGWVRDEENKPFMDVSTHSRPKAAEAFSETFIHQGLLSPDSLKLSENEKSEYNTAFSATLAFLIS
ncbi:Uncharacterised protein [Neisseria animaloris]|nr:hypothetical protein BWD08_10915 [Neisseria animaloris]VEH87964.1 Uncharacterised protein [Neisseria animaloris]